VHQEGDHKIHVAKVRSKSLKLDSRFNLDFDTAFATGPALAAWNGVEITSCGGT